VTSNRRGQAHESERALEFWLAEPGTRPGGGPFFHGVGRTPRSRSPTRRRPPSLPRRAASTEARSFRESDFRSASSFQGRPLGSLSEGPLCLRGKFRFSRSSNGLKGSSPSPHIFQSRPIGEAPSQARTTSVGVFNQPCRIAETSLGLRGSSSSVKDQLSRESAIAQTGNWVPGVSLFLPSADRRPVRQIPPSVASSESTSPALRDPTASSIRGVRDSSNRFSPGVSLFLPFAFGGRTIRRSPSGAGSITSEIAETSLGLRGSSSSVKDQLSRESAIARTGTWVPGVSLFLPSADRRPVRQIPPSVARSESTSPACLSAA
jgi:hypothetical protein